MLVRERLDVGLRENVGVADGSGITAGSALDVGVESSDFGASNGSVVSRCVTMRKKVSYVMMEIVLSPPPASQ
jgi:hypothetical protein